MLPSVAVLFHPRMALKRPQDCEPVYEDQQSPVCSSRSHLWVAVRQVPHVPCHLETAGTVPSLGYIRAHTIGEVVVLEISDCLRCESRTDEEEDSRRSDQEPVERGGGAGAVDQIAY